LSASSGSSKSLHIILRLLSPPPSDEGGGEKVEIGKIALLTDMVQHVKRCADSFRLFRCIFTAFIVIVGGYGEPWMRHWLVVRRRHWSLLLVRCVV